MPRLRIVLDTNVFVAAGFNRRSSSAQIIRGVEQGRFDLVWHQATRQETERILQQIPSLSWQDFAPLFTKASEYTGEIAPEDFLIIEDPDDRKFAALAATSGSVLITSDDHLLAPRATLGVEIRTPTEFMAQRKGTTPSQG
jgi:predicted nucleic acid-binding protein